MFARRMAAVFVGIALLAAPAQTSAAAEPKALPRHYVREQTAHFETVLAKAGAAAKVLEELKGTTRQDALAGKLAALGRAFETQKKYDVAADLVDRLRARGDLGSTLLAVDVLFAAVDALKVSAFASTKAIRGFPDDLCHRAADLLGHPNPLVQATAEWALALRVKKQDGSTRHIDRMFMAAEAPPAWYAAWHARPAGRALADDYARQLVHLNRHRTVDAVAGELDRIVNRMERMLADADSKPAGAPRDAFDGAAKAARAAVGAGDLDRAHRAYLALRLASRQVIPAARDEFPAEGLVFFTNPRIPGGGWNVNVAVTGRTNTPFGDIWRKPSADPAADAEPLLEKKALGDGAVRGIDLHWDADRVLFSYWHKPIDGSVPFGWNYHKNAHLYEMDLAAGRITQLTRSPGDNDVEPCYLPDGSYIFASDRSSFGNQCAGSFLQDKRCTTLYRLDPKGGPEPVAISNNKDFDRHPHVLNDGTVVFLHWEYQERTYLQGQNAWRCRPDGTNMDAFYKQHITRPYSMRDVRQAPGSDVCVATVQGHHDGHNGPVVLFRPSLGINNERAMRLLTPGCADIEGGLGPVAGQVVGEGGVENRGGTYINPFPMSEKAVLVGHDMAGHLVDFALYYIDVWGHRELLHRDADMSAFMPHPLRRRRRPPVVPDTVNPDVVHATVFVENVYRDLPGVEKGAVKYLRLSQRLMTPAPAEARDEGEGYTVNHLHFLPGNSTARHFGHWTWAPTRTVGTVEVETDGSAYFKVPAGTPLFLQALDEHHREVRRMRTSFTLQRGEFRGCTGCHETRYETVATRYPGSTLEKGPQQPVPPPWGDRRSLDYRTDIQPIFDRHCVSCHGRDDPDGGIELSGREIGGFYQSYRALFGLRPEDPTVVKEVDWHVHLHPEARGDAFVPKDKADDAIEAMEEGTWPGMLVSISNRHGDSSVTKPYQFGSNRSRLIRVLFEDKAHRDARAAMSREEWLKLVTWVDYNANYHSTLIDKSRWKSEKKLTRVPVYLPSPWTPADTNPPFLNTVDSSHEPPDDQSRP